MLFVGFSSLVIFESQKLNFSKNLGQTKLAGRVSVRLIQEKPTPPKKTVAKVAKKKVQKIKKKIKKQPVNSSAGSKNQGQKHKLAAYLSTVRLKIAQHKSKNRIANRLNLKGVVQLKFDLEFPNKIRNIEVINPSRYKALNQSALDSINRVETIPTFPDDIEMKKIEAVTVNLRYE